MCKQNCIIMKRISLSLYAKCSDRSTSPQMLYWSRRKRKRMLKWFPCTCIQYACKFVCAYNNFFYFRQPKLQLQCWASTEIKRRITKIVRFFSWFFICFSFLFSIWFWFSLIALIFLADFMTIDRVYSCAKYREKNIWENHAALFPRSCLFGSFCFSSSFA